MKKVRKTTESAAEVMDAIIDEVTRDVVAEYTIDNMVDTISGKIIGYGVTIILNKKYAYDLYLLRNWQRRLGAEKALIKYKGGELQLTYKVYCDAGEARGNQRGG